MLLWPQWAEAVNYLADLGHRFGGADPNGTRAERLEAGPQSCGTSQGVTLVAAWKPCAQPGAPSMPTRMISSAASWSWPQVLEAY